MRFKILLFVVYMALTAVYAQAEVLDEKVLGSRPGIDAVLGRLEEKMSEIRTLQTDFIQEKNLAVFNEKIVLKGRMFLQKPHLFAWHVHRPMRYSLVISGNTVRQWDEDTGRIQKVSLKNNPAFGVIIVQMKEWFSGAYKSLQADYKIKIRTQNPLSLEFTPRKDRVASGIINRVTIVFRGDQRYIQRIHIEEESGDSTLLSFVDTRLNEPLAAAAWEAKPRVQ